jgi:MSHA biogenesis protein MshG
MIRHNATIDRHMKTFNYIGRDPKNQKVSGEIEAVDLKEALAFLSRRGIIPLKLEPASPKLNILFTDFIKKMDFFPRKKIPLQNLLSFCRGMAALEEAGIPIVDAIRQLALTTNSKPFGSILNKIAGDITSGKTLANALRAHPNIFPILFINILEVGENTGNLSQTFLQLSTYLEMSQSNRRRITSAVRYPITVLIAISIAVTISSVFVIPKFATIFKHFKGTLPLATRIIIGTSNFFAAHWIAMIIGIIFIYFTILYLLRLPQVRLFWDQYKLRLPILGDLQHRIIILQFTWIFGLILRSGLPLIKGLELAARATGNSYFTHQSLIMCKNLEKGENFLDAATQSKLFPAAILQLIGAGEKSGKLEDILGTITEYYGREIDYSIKKVNDFVEPFILIIIGGMVVVLALGIYLPMWEMVQLQG